MIAPIPQKKAGRANIHASESKRSKSKRILIVDDDGDFRWIISQALRPFARKIDVVSNGCEAVEQINKRHYDAVLMDVHMPCKDGLDALRELRRTHRKIQVIILTLAPTADMIRDVYLEHADDFFVKPFFIEDMEPLIERLIMRIWSVDNGLVESNCIDGFWKNLKKDREEETKDELYKSS
jgi:CheY-like chemotaxis protein